MDSVIYYLNVTILLKWYWYDFIFQLEFDLVTTLIVENITVLLPSHIQEEDHPADMPNLFVRLMSLTCSYIIVLLTYFYLD